MLLLLFIISRKRDHFLSRAHVSTLGPFIREKISRGVHNTRKELFIRVSDEMIYEMDHIAFITARIIASLDYLYEYKLPGQDKPRLEKAVNVDFVPFIRGVRVLCNIFCRINGPIVQSRRRITSKISLFYSFIYV